MPIQTYVTFADDEKVHLPGTPNTLDLLGEKEQTTAMQLRELFLSVKGVIEETVEQEAELTVEITGSLELKASGGVQYLVINVGGESSKTRTMKVSMTTRLSPR